jgi:RimJ/RimL family protein N-acetyltransferase
VRLREKRIEDAETDFNWRIDPELARLDATTPLRLTLAEYTRYFKDELEFPSPWSVRLAVDTLDGEHIGNVMYYDVDERKRQAELGIMIGVKEYWGRGYGSDAVETALYHIFLDTGIERVYLHTLLWNDRAQAAFRKSGFHVASNVRKDGYEFLLMEVERETWLESHAGDAGGPTARQADSSSRVQERAP